MKGVRATATLLMVAGLVAAARLMASVEAQDNAAVAGTWRLVSYTSTTEKGEVKHFMGERPAGFITYTKNGRMSVIITAEERKPLSINDRISAPAEERAAAFATVIAYAGTYNFSGGKVTHHVEASAMPNQVGTDLVRAAKLDGDRLSLRTPPQLVGGSMVTSELVWERIK